jgi:hypothetical protein
LTWQYDDDGRFGFGNGQLIALTFCISQGAGSARVALFQEDQHVKPIEGGKSRLPGCPAQLKWWLQGFGDQVDSAATKPSESGA